jgi:hypothetical protein
MLKFVFVILYVLSGEVKLEQRPMPDMETCIEKGLARIEELQLDPAFDEGLYVNCMPLVVFEAQDRP